MKIGLIGYGKMGKMTEIAALERGHRIPLVIDPLCSDEQPKSGAVLSRCFPPNAEAAGNPDLFIEFTQPETAADNIITAARLGIPVVCGSTGWLKRLEEVSAAVEKAGSALLWSSNFSLGVNLFYRIAAYAAALADSFDQYDIGGLEIHHNKKADSPSGTARALIEKVLVQMKRKTKVQWEVPKEGKPDNDTIYFASLRQGSVPGTHSLFFDSPADTIEITHTARNREGLASGAILAAEWLIGNKDGKPRHGIYTMDDVLRETIHERV